MRTRINHNLKRSLSICIVVALLLSTIGSYGTIVYASETSFETATLSLKSNTVDDGSVELYIKDSVHYILIEDLCELVRCSWTEKNDVIWVTQGFWSATFNVKDQVFNDGYQIVEITILEVAPNKCAVPALMFLNYFKAAAFIENDTLYCEMPEFTAWEALNVDYANTLVDIYELYGGEGNVTLSLTLDIIMDFIMGDMSTSEDYLNDAFLTALKVDLYDYNSVQKYKETSQERLYSFLHSDKGEEFVEAVDDVLSVSAEPTQWYIQYYYNAIAKSFVNVAYDAFEAGQHTDVTHYGEKFYEAFTEKNKTSEAAKKYFDNADYVMLFVSAAVDTAQQMKYTNATDNLIYNVMGQDNLSYLGISPSGDNGWFTVANRYKNVLGVARTQLEAEAMQLFTDKLCWETLIGTGITSAAGISSGAWTFSLNFARLFVEKFPLTSSSVEAIKADRRALYLSELQKNVYWVAMNTLQDMQGQRDNPEIYSKYIQALQLYCRTSIAMYENLITMVDEFGKNRDYWTNLFQARIEMLAVSLYQLTTLQDDGINRCLPLELRSFSDQIASDDSYMTAIDANDINAINALLIGVGYPPDQAEGTITSWSDERIFDIICSKRLWDWDSEYLTKLGIGDEFSIDLSLVEELTQDMFDRSFPVNAQSGLGSVDGNKLNVELFMGESTELVVQNGTKQGNKVTVEGSVYHHYVPFSEFHGYFKAELVENPSSIYGYTLISIYCTEGNQDFDSITASASSELQETNLTHFANRAIDGNLDTAWVEGVHGVGINEWIKLESTDGSKITVSAIEFSLGYQKNKQLLQNNGWPNKVLIECESGYTQEAEFYTCYYADVVVLDQPQTTGWIKVTILEATSGAKCDDICISEICLYGIDPNKETIADNPDDGESLSTEHVFMSDEEESEIDLYLAFCKSLSSVYTSSDGSTAGMKSCVVVDFKEDVPNLVVHYINPNAYGSPGTFYEVWMIYGIVSGQVVELFKEENPAPTRRSINLVYDEENRYALREEQAFSGYYDVIIHYPTNVSDTAMYENYNYIHLPEESHILRVWSITGDYVDISF